MAASKLHLKNVDKSYKLVPTDQKTDAGRIIYKNAKTGELHSELSVTVEYPANSGKWINVPSLLNGRVYNAKGVLDMLKAGKLTPTSTHMNEEEALETAQFRSNNLSIQPASEDELVADGIERDAIGRIVEPLMANGSPNGRGNNVYMSDVSIATAANAVSDKDAINAQQAILADIELSNDFASTFPTEEENPNGLFVRAAQPDYTSGSGANADILAAAETALASDQQTQRLGAIMDNQALEKQDDYYKYYPNSARNTDPNFSGTPQPERISERATQYLEPEGSARAARERAIGRSMESYGNRTGGVNPLNSNTMLAEGSPNGRGINYSREYINPLRNMVDLSNIESLTDNGAPGSEFDVNKRMGAAMSSYGERIGEDAYRENLMNDAMQSYGERTGMSTGAAAAVERKRKASLKELAAILDKRAAEKEDDYFDVSKPRTHTMWGDNNRKYRNPGFLQGWGDLKPVQNKDSGMTISAADQEMFDAAKLERFGSEKGNVGIPGYGATNQGTVSPTDQAIFDAAKAERFGLESGNVGIEGYKNDGKVSAADQAMFDKASKARGFSNEGPATRQSNKPMFDFEYKPHMRPEEKMNDARSLKGLTPDYGKMPGFKLPTNDKGESTGNYWSADENSDFWKTDAGYQKAQETWGQNLPTFVKKPQRKDIDIAAIKKFFTSSR